MKTIICVSLGAALITGAARADEVTHWNQTMLLATLVRRTAPKNQLVLEISEQRADGRHFDRRLIFEKQ